MVAYLNFANKDNAKKSTVAPKSSGLQLASSSDPASKNNRSNQIFAFGFVNYKASAFDAVSGNQVTGIEKLEVLKELPTENGLSSVAFLQGYNAPYDTKLLMYDFKTEKVYTIIKEDIELVRHYYNPVILSNHYVAYYELTYKDPITLEGSIKVLDLLTGQTKEIVKDSAGNLPNNLCCATSPNGLYLAVPKYPNKIEFFSAGNSKSDELTLASISFLPKMKAGTGDNQILGDEGYAKAQLSSVSGYPQMQWIDNNRVVMANNPPKSFIGATPSNSNNGLSILSVNSGDLAPISNTENFSVTWFDITGSTLVFSAEPFNIKESGDAAKDLRQLGTKFYKVNLEGTNRQPQKIEYTYGNKIPPTLPYVLDKTKGILYMDQSSTLIAMNIGSGKIKTYSVDTINPLVGLLDSERLIYGTTDVTSDSPSLMIYNLLSGKTTKVY